MNTTTALASRRIPEHPAAATVTPERRRTAPAWSPWPTPSRPAITAEERRFVAALTDAADDALGEFTRTDVTLVLNALRCGVSVPQLATLAPGMRPERLLGAYVALDSARGRSVRAWRSIVSAAEHVDTTELLAALAAHATEAAKLLPTKVVRLLEVAGQRPADLARVVRRASIEVSVQAAHVERIETAIDRVEESEEWAHELGALLYDPFGDAVANHPDFLPERVGLLNPTRVAALLGERPLPIP